MRDALRRLETAGRTPAVAQLVPQAEVGPVRSIVAMPTRMIGPEASRFLADAIPNLISRSLEAAQSIEVRRSPSTVEVERLDADPSRVAALSGADAYVSSAVIAIEQDLLLDLQVIDVRTQQAISGSRIDGTRERYRDLIRRAVEDISTALNLVPVDPVQVPATAARGHVDLLLQRATYRSASTSTGGAKATSSMRWPPSRRRTPSNRRGPRRRPASPCCTRRV